MVIGDIIDALKKDLLRPQSSFACFRTWLKLGGEGGWGKGHRKNPDFDICSDIFK